MIQWFPGHMAKALREMQEKISLVDLVIVLLDARIPLSSYNPVLKSRLANKKTLYVMTKRDKADESKTVKWLDYYQSTNSEVIALNSHDKVQIKGLIKTIMTTMEAKFLRDQQRGLKKRPVKIMIVGIPNVGKSTLINALVGKKATVVGDRPGVTKAQQWIRINEQLELLDTPGVLWPKFEDVEVAYHLALTGAIKDTILKPIDLAVYAIGFLNQYYPLEFKKRYQVEIIDQNYLQGLEQIAIDKNYYLVDQSPDLEKTALLLINDLRHDQLARITFDQIPVTVDE